MDLFWLLMAQINYLDLGNQQQLQIWKLVGYFRNCDILKIGCFWQNPKIHENWRCQNWLFWPFSISNLCHRQTIRDRSMKPIANNSLGSQFLQEKSPMWKISTHLWENPMAQSGSPKFKIRPTWLSWLEMSVTIVSIHKAYKKLPRALTASKLGNSFHQ